MTKKNESATTAIDIGFNKKLKNLQTPNLTFGSTKMLVNNISNSHPKKRFTQKSSAMQSLPSSNPKTTTAPQSNGTMEMISNIISHH